MNNKRLYFYPNCSLGGMGTVLRNRMKSAPSEIFHFHFLNNEGGEAMLRNLGADVYFSKRHNVESSASYITNTSSFNSVNIISMPGIVNAIKSNKDNCGKIIYEFHTSSLPIINKELSLLDLEEIDEIWVPSETLAVSVRRIIHHNYKHLVKVKHNIADCDIFTPIGECAPLIFENEEIPILWVGRIDSGKNWRSMLRALAMLPKEYTCTFVLSLDDDPVRVSQFLSEVYYLNLNERVTYLFKINTELLASIKRSFARKNGCFVSTSLNESFGYSVLEACLSGLPSISYDVGALHEHLQHKNIKINFIPPGESHILAETIMRVTDKEYHSMERSSLEAFHSNYKPNLLNTSI